MAVIGKALGSQVGTSSKGGYPAKSLTISPKNATPALTPKATTGANAAVTQTPQSQYSPMPNNQLAMNPPMNKPPTISADQHASFISTSANSVPSQMDRVGGKPNSKMDTSHYRQNSVSGPLFGIQGFPRGGTLGL